MILLSVNQDSFIFSFPIRMSLLFSCLAALFKTCSTTLSRRCKSEYLCLEPNSIDQAFSFLPLCMLCKIFCMCLSAWGYSLLFFPCWGFLSTHYTTIDAKWNSSGLWRIMLVRNLDRSPRPHTAGHPPGRSSPPLFLEQSASRQCSAQGQKALDFLHQNSCIKALRCTRLSVCWLAVLLMSFFYASPWPQGLGPVPGSGKPEKGSPASHITKGANKMLVLFSSFTAWDSA